MRYLFLGTGILIVLFTHCTDDKLFKDKYTLVPIDNVRIEISSNSKNFTEIQSFESNNTEFIASLNSINNSIEFYNLETQKYFKEIRIDTEGSNAFGRIESFYIISFDSILVFSSGRPKMGLLDGNGVIIKSIPYEKDYLGKEVSKLATGGGVKPIKINTQVFLPQIYRALESNGILTEAGHYKSNIAISADISSVQVITLPLTYPKELIGKDVSAMPYKRIHGFGNTFIYCFGNLIELYVTNDHITYSSYPIETNYDLYAGESLNSFTDIQLAINKLLLKDEIVNLYYDSFRYCYYILIRKRQNETSFDNFEQTRKNWYFPTATFLFWTKILNILVKSISRITHIPFRCVSLQKKDYIFLKIISTILHLVKII